MPIHCLAISEDKDVYNETKKYHSKLNRKNSIQSYNDTFINNYYQYKALKNPTTIPHIITKTNKIDSTEAITLKVSSEKTNVDTTNFVTTDDIISSPVTLTVEDNDTIPTSIFLSPTISKLVNDINETLYERVTAIKNKNIKINNEILEMITKFKNDQHELFLNIIDKIENKKTDSSNNNDDNTINSKTEENNNNDDGKKILNQLLLNIKKDNIELLNKIDTNLIYNINLKYASINNHSNDKDVISFINSNGENKTILFQQTNEEIFTENEESTNNIINKEQKEDIVKESENVNNLEDLEVQKEFLKQPTIERLKTNTNNYNAGSTTSITSMNSSIKRFMKVTCISKLSMNSKQSSSEIDMLSQKDKKRKKSLFKRKEQNDDSTRSVNLCDKKHNKNDSNKYLMPSREYNFSVESFNISSNSLNSLSSENLNKKESENEIHLSYDLKSKKHEGKNKHERKTHSKSHSEILEYNQSSVQYITPLPISNVDNRNHRRWSSVPASGDNENIKDNNKINDKDKKKEKKKEKDEEKEKKIKEKERRKEEEKEKKIREKEKKKEEEKEKKIKEKEKELEKEKKKEEERERKIKEKELSIKNKKKKKGNKNLQKTSSIVEIRKRMVNVFDNYQVKLLDREPGSHPILTHEIADKILPNITPSAFKEYRNWKLIYSLEYHGSHPQTMYDAIYEKMPLVTAIMDEDGCIFGAYSTEYFHVDTHYYGNGQTFLWKYVVNENKEGELKIYRATGSNHYYIISEKNYLAFGGGKGFGLHITDEFTYGFTDNCETYNNEVLACKKEFKCINMEVWCLEL